MIKTGEEIYKASMQLYLEAFESVSNSFDKKDLTYIFRMGLMQGMEMSQHVNWEQRMAFLNAAKKDLGIL